VAQLDRKPESGGRPGHGVQALERRLVTQNGILGVADTNILEYNSCARQIAHKRRYGPDFRFGAFTTDENGNIFLMYDANVSPKLPKQVLYPVRVLYIQDDGGHFKLVCHKFSFDVMRGATQRRAHDRLRFG